jgi:hypothetical protein
MMEEICPSDTLVHTRATRRRIPEGDAHKTCNVPSLVMLGLVGLNKAEMLPAATHVAGRAADAAQVKDDRLGRNRCPVLQNGG